MLLEELLALLHSLLEGVDEGGLGVGAGEGEGHEEVVLGDLEDVVGGMNSPGNVGNFDPFEPEFGAECEFGSLFGGE